RNSVLSLYGEALTKSGGDGATAETVLKRLTGSPESDDVGLRRLIIAKAFLSRVLRRREKLDEAKDREDWLVKWFRENPHLIPEGLLRHILIPGGETTSPILEALGGAAWLDDREQTQKTAHRLIKMCTLCQSREPMVKL
ncbi:hypothetical protein DAEQUDRAFT_651863, partial [Daedalea quercina L-15889]